MLDARLCTGTRSCGGPGDVGRGVRRRSRSGGSLSPRGPPGTAGTARGRRRAPATARRNGGHQVVLAHLGGPGDAEPGGNVLELGQFETGEAALGRLTSRRGLDGVCHEGSFPSFVGNPQGAGCCGQQRLTGEWTPRWTRTTRTEAEIACRVGVVPPRRQGPNGPPVRCTLNVTPPPCPCPPGPPNVDGASIGGGRTPQRRRTVTPRSGMPGTSRRHTASAPDRTPATRSVVVSTSTLGPAPEIIAA